VAFYKPNAVLTFNDGITDLTLEVCIKRKQDPKILTDPGLQNIRLFYVGNSVKPKVFPESLIEGSKALIDIDSGNIQGDFLFFDIHRTRFKSVENSLGQTFSGYVIPKKVNNDSDWA
jgi:hypothetical protein